MLLGAHESTSGGYYKALEMGKSDGCDCVQIFTQSPRMWKGRSINENESVQWKIKSEEFNIKPNCSHAIYLLNLAHEDEAQRIKSINNLIKEFERCEKLGLKGVVLHPGSNKDKKKGLILISESVNTIFNKIKGFRAKLFLEITAGHGNNLCSTFEELHKVIKNIYDNKRVGVCFDTCHAYSAGYDLANEYDKVFKNFDKIIGLKRLECFHLNDSKNILNSHIDRHEHIGKGNIGLKFFEKLVNDKRFKNIPGYLETPGEGDYRNNLQILRKLIKQ
ncbi:deoxyribonuclease IV [archaeon CG06_land_8_20_14_3_00_37_11]|nr:MAG: deoxyribonuclease IV [archaeon CG06_land_8_20_14_3_00_37_11]